MDNAMDNDTSSVTCTACRVQLIGTQSRRDHYRSDLHRVNLKRKIAGIGALTSIEFEHRVQALQAEKKAHPEQISRRRERKASKGTHYCEVCCKKFSSEKALENHNSSRRHRDRLHNIEQNVQIPSDRLSASILDTDSEIGQEINQQIEMDDDDILSIDSSDSEAIEAELERRLDEWKGAHTVSRTCPFDGLIYSTSKDTLEHMTKEHGFFIAFAERLVKADELIGYCGQKVAVGYACLACDKGFTSVEAVRAHMNDVGHCQMTIDEDIWMDEFGEFYNWGPLSNQSNDNDDDGEWEEINEDEIPENAIQVRQDYGTVSTIMDQRPVGRLDTGDEDDGNEEHAYGLALSGKVIGHRSFAKYYRQSRGRKVDERAAVIANKTANAVRVVGWKSKLEEGKVMPLREKRWQSKQSKRFALMVGGQNYYTRKARFKQKMAVFNSGYRA